MGLSRRYQPGALKPTHRIVALFRDPRQRRRSEFLYYVRRRDPGGFFPKDLAKQLSWFVLDEKRPLEERWKFYLALMKPYAGCMTNLVLGRFCVSAGRPNATASAQAVALVESELEFARRPRVRWGRGAAAAGGSIPTRWRSEDQGSRGLTPRGDQRSQVGLQSEWARTVCLFHATCVRRAHLPLTNRGCDVDISSREPAERLRYGGVVFPNEALLPHGGIARDTTALDNVRPHPFEDPDRALFAAAADRFRRDVDSRRRNVEDCEVRLKTTARRERCSDTPPRPERWTRSNATRPCPRPPRGVSFVQLSGGASLAPRSGPRRDRSPRPRRDLSRPRDGPPPGTAPSPARRLRRPRNIHAAPPRRGRPRPIRDDGTGTVYAAAHMWTHCSSKRWITKNICHRTCTALGLPRELTCDGVARVTNFSTVPGGAPHTTCTGATPRAPGPSGEVWRPCEVF